MAHLANPQAIELARNVTTAGHTRNSSEFKPNGHLISNSTLGQTQKMRQSGGLETRDSDAGMGTLLGSMRSKRDILKDNKASL